MGTGAHLHQRSQPLLGTFVVIAVHGTGADSAITDAFSEVRRLDEILSLHRADSELVHLNARAVAEPVRVSEELFAVIAKAQEIAAATEGSFDITIRPLAALWGFIWKEQRMPEREAIATVLPSVNYRLIALDPSARTVRFLAPNISIDLGGIAKGYIVDRAIEVLRARGFTNALVRAGGDLRASGAPPRETAWEIQLEDPRKEGRRTRIRLRDAAISTSGDYENYLQVGGKRYGHILNPRTGWPAEGVAGCSVIAPTCMQSDALATAFFVLGPDRAMRRFGERYQMRFALTDGRVVANF